VQSKLKRRLRLPPEQAPVPVEGWREALEASAGRPLAVGAALDHGFVDLDAGLAVVAAGDVLGSGARILDDGGTLPAPLAGDLAELHLGDVVVHLDYGVGVLEGIEAVGGPDAPGDAIRLRFAEGQALLVPAEEAGRLWRYGSADSEVALDRLDTDAWEKRRAKIMAGLAETARGLVAAIADRRGRAAPKLAPRQPHFERFAARFPYPPTPDQRRAIDAALADLVSGVPMNRLVIGDVGFGKDGGRAARRRRRRARRRPGRRGRPTTVLARQHFETFRRRFEGLGVEVAHLSRLVPPKEAKRVKAGLADGGLHVAVGTHALLGKGVAFAGLAFS
jgi:transcription-repair coupling factor (superfamily II helicase)